MIFSKKEDKKEHDPVIIVKTRRDKIHRKLQVQDPVIKVKKGEIRYTESYKYLGDMYDIHGSNMRKRKKKMEKENFMAYDVKKGGDYKEVGKADPWM